MEQRAGRYANNVAAYGAAGWPRPVQDLVIAFGMARRRGFRATLTHSRTVALLRLQRRLVDRHRLPGLPWRAEQETVLDGMPLASGRDWERDAAVAHSSVPANTLEWGLAGLAIDPADFHFVDAGSGSGQALLHAARFPFRSITGLELAETLHQRAVENVAWAVKHSVVPNAQIHARNQSVLDAALPDGPTIIHLFNPFLEPVMSRFLEHVLESVRVNPRPLFLLYVNPVEEGAFARPEFVVRRLARREQVLIDLLSPFAVRAYSCEPLRNSASAHSVETGS